MSEYLGQVVPMTLWTWHHKTGQDLSTLVGPALQQGFELFFLIWWQRILRVVAVLKKNSPPKNFEDKKPEDSTAFGYFRESL